MARKPKANGAGPTVLTSVRPRPGRRFEPVKELELESDAIRAAQDLPGTKRGLMLIREASGPFGIPDLLALVGPPEPLQARLRLAVAPLLNEVDAGIVAAATTGRPRRADTLARQLGWSEETVRRRIPDLVRTGALTHIGKDSYVRPDALTTVGRLYAIETKVKEWRRAIRQARAYSLWCDTYVVVMPSIGPTSLSGVLEAITRDSAGLVVAGSWLARPRLGTRTGAQRLWGSEHVVAAIQAGGDVRSSPSDRTTRAPRGVG